MSHVNFMQLGSDNMHSMAAGSSGFSFQGSDVTQAAQQQGHEDSPVTSADHSVLSVDQYTCNFCKKHGQNNLDDRIHVTTTAYCNSQWCLPKHNLA